MSAYLIPLPGEFQIKVSAVREIDDSMQPMKAEVFDGHFVSCFDFSTVASVFNLVFFQAVGEFGTVNLLDTKASMLPNSLGLTDEDVLEMILQRSYKALVQYCRKLSEIFTHPKPYSSIEGILEEVSSKLVTALFY